MVDKHPVIMIQARMNSERLPGKVLLRIAGMPLIGIQISRLKRSGLPIILATSTNRENDPLCDYAQEQGIKVFRGSEHDVLERFYLASKEIKAEVIIRVTGDNPLVDGNFIKAHIHDLKNFGARTYFSTGRSRTFPVGLSFECFSFELLEEAQLNATLTGQREHVTPYMHQNVPGDIDIRSASRTIDKHHYRLTVDTQEDLDLMTLLIEKYHCHLMDYDEIVQVLDSHPELCKINNNIKQKDWK